MGVGFVPGIAPLVVSMVVPMGVQYAKHAQTEHQSVLHDRRVRAVHTDWVS